MFCLLLIWYWFVICYCYLLFCLFISSVTSEELTSTDIERCLYSIGDNHSFLRGARDPIDKMIVYPICSFSLSPLPLPFLSPPSPLLLPSLSPPSPLAPLCIRHRHSLLPLQIFFDFHIDILLIIFQRTE